MSSTTAPDNLSQYIDLLPSFIKEPNPNVYKEDNYVYLDFETTNLDKGSPYNTENRIVFAAWKLGESHPNYDGETTYYKWGGEYSQSALVDACEKASFIVAHNAKFELGWLRRCGLNISSVLPYCTQIGEYVIAGDRQWRLTLEQCLARRGIPGKGEVISLLLKNGVCPSTMPAKWLQKYGINDVVQGHALFLHQRARLVRDDLLPVQFTRCVFTPVLESLERTGIHVDEGRVRKVHGKYTNELNELQEEMDKFTGGINTKSPVQKANFLYNVLKFPLPKDFRGNIIRGKPPVNPETMSYKYFPEGVPTTDSKITAKLKARTKRQRDFFVLLSKINKLKDAKAKTLDKLLQCVEETEDNILYARFNQTITSTHRLSSSGATYKIQFQNLARVFKPLLSPRYPGWKMAENDEAQLEYRVAVFLGRDEAGLHDILNDVDSHGITASIIFKEEWEKCGGDKHSSIGKRVRTAAKEHTFKPLFGGTSGTDNEREYYTTFMNKHKGITEAQQRWKKSMYQTRKLRTITGLTFYWEDAAMNRRGMLIRPDGRPVDQSICNYPVQSLATADMVPIAVVVQWHLMLAAKMKSFLINTVHDSSLGEVHPEETELYEEIGVYSMTDYVIYYLDKVYGIDFNVPLEAETEFSDFWGTSPEWEKEYLNEL